jgi:hypothetical protein
MDKLIKKILKEETQRYMFFSNLEQMHRQIGLLLDLDKSEIESILDDGHDWAQDHIAEAKNNMDQVFDFLMNETKSGDMWKSEEMTEDDNIIDDLAMAKKNPDEALSLYQMNEGRKKAGTKLCARGKASAKAKYKVYPSAYSNGHAVQVCKGTIKGLDGKKKCSSPYC